MSVWEHLEIIIALIKREVTTRFGQERLSYLWALIVPLSWIGFGILAFSALDRVIPISAHPALFLATGILPYVIFRQTITYVTRSVITAERLLDMPRVQLGHMVIAFAYLEGLTMAIITVAVLGGLTFILQTPPPAEPLKLMAILALTWIMGALIAAATSLLALRFRVVNRILPLVLRPFFWISGVFFVATELPPNWSKILAINPLFPLIDGTRDAVFATYSSPLFSFGETGFVIASGIACLCAAFLLRTRFHLRGVAQ